MTDHEPRFLALLLTLSYLSHALHDLRHSFASFAATIDRHLEPVPSLSQPLQTVDKVVFEHDTFGSGGAFEEVPEGRNVRKSERWNTRAVGLERGRTAVYRSPGDDTEQSGFRVEGNMPRDPAEARSDDELCTDGVDAPGDFAERCIPPRL